MADNWKNNVLPSSDSLDLGSLAYDENTSLPEIAGKYTNLGSQVGGLANAAFEDVHTRQTKLIGNDFGSNPMMYATYYQPTANDLQSEMRIKGTEKALSEGMERGKAAAEADLKNAQNQYNSAMDAYKNAKEAFSQLKVTTIDPNQLPEGVTESEMMSYNSFTGDRETARANIKAYTDAQDVDWSKGDIWSHAAGKTVETMGVDTSNWQQKDWDNFWASPEAGRIFTNNYVSEYIGTVYGEEKQKEYEASYNEVLTKIDQVFDYINNITDTMPDTEIEGLFYLPDNPSTELSSGDTFEQLFDQVLSGKQTEEERYQYTYTYFTEEKWIREHIAEEYQEEVLGKAKQMKGDGTASGIYDSEHSKKVRELIAADNTLSVPEASAKASAELGKEYYEYLQSRIKKEEANANITKRATNAGEVVENLFGFDINDMKLLTKWKKENPDEYESYSNQLAQVMGLSNTFEVADGERYYWTGSQYEQLKAGTPVFYAYSGAIDKDGNIVDDDLKKFVDMWNDFYSADVDAIGPDELSTKQEALNDAYKKYMEHVSAATMVNSVFNVQITPDIYNEIVGSFNGNISESDYEIGGQKISDVIKEFNSLSQGEKYRAWTDLIKSAYSATGKFLRYTDVAGGIVSEDINYKGDSDAAGYTKLDDTNTALGTGTKEPSKYANMTAVEAIPYFLAFARSMEQYNNGTTNGNIDPAFMDENFFQFAGKDLGQQVMGTLDFWGAALAFAGGVVAAPINAIIGNDPDPTHNEFMGIKGLSAANVIGAAFSGTREYDMENGWQSAEYLAGLDKRNREYAASVINPILIDVYFGDQDKDISSVRGLGDAYTSEGGGILRNWNSAWKTGVSFADMFLVNWVEGQLISGVATGSAKAVSAAANSKAAARLQLSLLPAMIRNSSDATLLSGKVVALSDTIADISSLIDNIDDPTQLLNSLKAAVSEMDDLGIDTTNIAKLISDPDDIESIKKAANILTDMRQSGALDKAVNTVKAIDNGNFGVLSSERAAALSSLSTNDLSEMLTNFGDVVKAASKNPSTKGIQQALAGMNKIKLASGEVVSAFDATVAVAANRVTGVMTLASSTGASAQSLAQLPDNARQILLRTLNGMTSASGSTITNKGLRAFLKSMTPDDFKALASEFISRNEVNMALGKSWDTFDTYRAAAAAGWERSGVTALTREFLTDALTDPLRDFKRNVSVPQVDEEGNTRVQTVQEYFTDPGNLLTNLAISTAHFGVSRMYNQIAGTTSAHLAEKAWNAYNATGDKASAEAKKSLQKAMKLNAKAQQYADKAWKRGLSFERASKNVELSNKIVDDAVRSIFKDSSWDIDYGGKTKTFKNGKEFVDFMTNKNMPAKEGLFTIANSVNIKAINNYYMYKTQIGTAWNELGNIPQSSRIKLLSTINKVHKDNIADIRAGKGSFDEKNHQMYQLMKEAVIDANNAGEYGVKIRNLEKSLNGFFGNLEAMSKAGRADGTLKQQRIGYIPISSLYFDGSYDDMVQSHRMAATRGLLHEGGSVDVAAANPAAARDVFSLDNIITAMEKGEKILEVKDKDGNVLRTVQLDYDGTNVLDMMVSYSNNYNLHKYVDPLVGDSRTQFGKSALQNNHAYVIGDWNRMQKTWNRDVKYAADRLRGYDYWSNGKKVHQEGWYEKIAARAIADGSYTKEQMDKLFKKGVLEVNVKESDKTELGNLRKRYSDADKKMKAAKQIIDDGDAPDSIYPFVSSVFHLDKNGVPDIEEAKVVVENGRRVAKVLVKAYADGEITEESLRTGHTIVTQSGLRDIMIDETMLNKLDFAAKHNGQIDSDLIFYAAVMNEQATPYVVTSNKRGIKTKAEDLEYVNRLKSSQKQKLEVSGDTKLGKIGDYNVYTGKIKPGDKDTIFVFGSNPEGRHGKGAAYVAKTKFGAKQGQGEGLQGNSYALPTKDLRGQTYEVSTAGDKRFSALNAKFAKGTEILGVDVGGRTIEDVYQNIAKASGKGKAPAKDSPIAEYIAKKESEAGKKLTQAEKVAVSQKFMDRLWDIWGEQNPDLKAELAKLPAGTKLTDKFSKSNTVSQATSLQRWVAKGDSTLRSISPEQITKSIKKMYSVAEQNPTKKFKVAYASDDNLNGYSLKEMANMFKNAGKAPENVYFSQKMGELLAGKIDTRAEIADANVAKAIEVFGNDEGKVTFGGKESKNARTGKVTVAGGVEVDAARFYSAEMRLGRNESGDIIEKTSERNLRDAENAVTASLYASTDAKISKGEYAPTAFQKRYAETVIDLTKTELGDSGESFDGGGWLLAIDKNAGDPALVKLYGVDNDVSYTAVSKDGKVSTKKTNLAQRVKNLEQAGALGAFRDNLESASIRIMAGEYDSFLPNGMSRESLATIAVKARNFMDTGENYGYHPKRSETMSTMVDEEGNVLDQTQAYSDIAFSNLRGETEQVYGIQGRSIDLDKANVEDHLKAFKFAVEAFSDESNPLHEIFTNESLNNLVAKRSEFNAKTQSIAEELNTQAKALYDSGGNPEFNKTVDEAYQNIVARTQKYGGKAGDNEIKFQYLEALGIAAPGSGLNSIGTGAYGQSTRRFYAAQTAMSTGIEDLSEEGWSSAVTKMRLDAGSQEGYANQLIEGIQRFQKIAGENDDTIKLLDNANETLSAIKSLTGAKPFGAEDNFESSVIAMFADVYDRKAMSPLANRAEIAQASRDAKWRVENLVSETLTGKKLHNEGMRVEKAGDSANTTLSYSANQMAIDLAGFYGAYKNLNADEFAAQYWRHGASDYVPGDLAEIRGRYNVILQNLYDKYVQETDTVKPVKSKAAPMTKEQFAANVVAKDDAMFKRVFDARTTKNKSPIEDYDEAGRTLLAKKIASEENAELDSMYKSYIGKEASTKARTPKKMTIGQFENRLLKNMDSFERYYSDLYNTSVKFAEMGGDNVLAPSAIQGKTSIFTPEQLSFAAVRESRHWIPEDFFADVKIDGKDTRATVELDFGTAQELSDTAVGLRVMRDTGDEIDMANLSKSEHQQLIEKVIKPYLQESNSGLTVLSPNDVNATPRMSRDNPAYDWSKSKEQNIDENGKQIEPYIETGYKETSYGEQLQDLGYGYKLVGVPREDDPLREMNFSRSEEFEENPKTVASRALAEYTEYTKHYNPAEQVAKAQKDFDEASKELDSVTKKGEKVSNKVKKGTLTIDDLAKKTLSEDEYLSYKQDREAYKLIKEKKPVEGGDYYESVGGKFKIFSGNMPAGYTTLKNLLDMLGYDSKNFNHDITEGRVYTDEEIAKDYKERKKMMKEVNKNLRKGNVKYRNVEEYKNPTALDIKSRTATINNLLAFAKQVSDTAGYKKGDTIDSAHIAVDKEYADLLYRISREGIGPTNAKGYVKKAAFELTDWNKFVQDFQLAGGASYVNAMTIAQMRGAIFSNPMKMAEYLKLVVDFKDDAAVANFVVKNSARLSEIAMKVGDTSILTDFQASASDRPGFEDNGTFSAATHRMIDSYDRMKATSRTGGEKYDFAKDTIQHNVDALFTDATFNRMLPVLRAKMLIANYDNATRALKRHFKNFRNPSSSVDEESLADAAAKYAYARTTAFFEPNKTAGGLWRNKSITETLDNIYDDNLRRFLSSWTGAKDDISIGQMASNCFFALGYKQRMIQPLLQGTKSMFGIGNIKDRLSMARPIDESTPDLLEKLGTQFMQGGNRQQLRTLGVIAIGAFVTAKSLGLATSWDDLSFVDEADGEFKVPDILKKFQTVGQIWIPNAVDENGNPIIDPTKPAYNIDTMSSIFTLPNVGWKTLDRMFNGNSYYSAPQRGLPFLGVNNPVNQFVNSDFSRAIGDELIGSNLLSPYKAMYEVLVDSSYYGNNIWEKKYLSDGSKNPNYDPARNVKASFFHILGLDNYRTLSPRKYNDYVKGYYTDKYKAQDQIGSIGGAGILQHEYITAVINILEGDALEGVIEAGELPIKKQRFSSTARTDFNTRVKNIIAEAMAEYNNKTEGETNADVKDAAYADAVKKSADAVAAWSSKYDFVLGRDQSLVPYVTRSMMAVLSGEYDDRLDYIQNTYWKASQIAQIEATGPAGYWLDDADIDAWLDSGKTAEEFAAEKNKRHDAYNKALDDEYKARKALHDAGIDNEYLAGMSLQNLKAEQRAVNRGAYTQAMGIVNGKIGEFDNFKEMKAYYESQIDAATTKKAKAKLANQYNTYLTDALAPLVKKYGAGIIGDGYYNNDYLSNHLADYVIIPADKYYVGKSPRASYLRDLFGVGYKDFSNEPSDEEVIEGYNNAFKQMQKGNSASAVTALDRTIDAIKKGQLHVTDSDYNKIIRMRALLSARSK